MLPGYIHLLLSDALHAQKKTASVIISKGADYVLQVKGNQETLHQTLEERFDKSTKKSFIKLEVLQDYYSKVETTRGRSIISEVSTIQDSIFNSLLSDEWAGLKTIVRVHRYGSRSSKGISTNIDETTYAISCRNLNAKEAFTVIRNHWKIENNLHRQKDYTYKEDSLKNCKGHAILTFMRSITISIITFFKNSIILH